MISRPKWKSGGSQRLSSPKRNNRLPQSREIPKFILKLSAYGSGLQIKRFHLLNNHFRQKLAKRTEKETDSLKRFLFQKKQLTQNLNKAYKIFRNNFFKKSNIKHWPKEQIHLYISNNNTKHLHLQI